MCSDHVFTSCVGGMYIMCSDLRLYVWCWCFIPLHNIARLGAKFYVSNLSWHFTMLSRKPVCKTRPHLQQVQRKERLPIWYRVPLLRTGQSRTCPNGQLCVFSLSWLRLMSIRQRRKKWQYRISNNFASGAPLLLNKFALWRVCATRFGTRKQQIDKLSCLSRSGMYKGQLRRTRLSQTMFVDLVRPRIFRKSKICWLIN